MIDVEKGKIRFIMEDFHNNVEERWTKNDDESLMMSRILDELIKNPKIAPRDCADILNTKYIYNISGNDVIYQYRKRFLGNPKERESIIEWCENVEKYFEGALLGDKISFDKFNNERKINVLRTSDGSRNPQNYILLNMIFRDYPEIDIFNDFQKIKNLPVIPCKFLLYELVDIIAEHYGFETFKSSKSRNTTIEEKLSIEQLKRKVNLLESRLERTSLMMKELENDFASQLDATKTQELTQFFSSLNSEKYGFILDELLLLRRGVDELRKNNYEVPQELNGVLIMIKKLIQFIRDSHINPIMKVNSINSVTAADIEFCNYEGTPFSSNDEVKQVKVVSPGWIFSDKDIQISIPHVKEITND
jgi:hypothetical protein